MFKKAKKFSWHFLEPPPPLECHNVLFEWPLRIDFDCTWYESEQFYSIRKNFGLQKIENLKTISLECHEIMESIIKIFETLIFFICQFHFQFFFSLWF